MEKTSLVSSILSTLSTLPETPVQIDNGEWVIPGDIVDGVQSYYSVKIGSKGTKAHPFNLDTAVASFEDKVAKAKAREAKRGATKYDASVLSEANAKMQESILSALSSDYALTAPEIITACGWTDVTSQKVTRLCTSLVNLGKVMKTEKDKKVAYTLL